MTKKQWNILSKFQPLKLDKLIHEVKEILKQIKKPKFKFEFGFFFVTRPGFEPRLTVPKTAVLPLHHQAIAGANITMFLHLTNSLLNK